jgi:hypothetical protein
LTFTGEAPITLRWVGGMLFCTLFVIAGAWILLQRLGFIPLDEEDA